MALEALPFVNWAFWAALGSGTILVVGVTEVLGGTTRGYRLFMAWVVAAFAAILLVSDLALAPGSVAGSTAELRRALIVAFTVCAAAYLVASIASWPRAGLAVAGGVAGLAALVVLALAGGTLSTPLFATQLIVASVVLGATNAAMLLGHWYLVTPRLSPAPLRRMMWILMAALVAQAAAFAVAIVAVERGALGGGIEWLAWLRLAVGVLLPIVVTVLALLASRAASLQASTGLLYIGLALVMAGSIAGTSITYITGVPV